MSMTNDPSAPPINSPYVRPGSDPKRFMYDHYVAKRQFAKLFGAAIRIYGPGGQLVAYVQQKAFKLKEDIRVFGDEGKVQELLTIKARQVMDFGATYDITDSASGERVGSLQRKALKSILRDEWWILGPDGAQIGRAMEDSMALAMIRRFLSNLVPQSYDVELHGQKKADYRQRFNPFLYQMDLDFSPDPRKELDRRIGLCVAVMLALIEGRQG